MAWPSFKVKSKVSTSRVELPVCQYKLKLNQVDNNSWEVVITTQRFNEKGPHGSPSIESRDIQDGETLTLTAIVWKMKCRCGRDLVKEIAAMNDGELECCNARRLAED